MTEEIKAGQIIEYDKDNTPHFIIDGVDVSECGFLDIHRPTKLLLCEECNSDFAAMECKDDPNCYYKQLKRLESENTKLKGSNESLLRQFSARILVSGTEALFNITTAEFNYQIQRLKEENKKLKQALEQIKEVLSFCYSEESTEIPCIDCKYYEECKVQPIDYVIRIIEEVSE